MPEEHAPEIELTRHAPAVHRSVGAASWQKDLGTMVFSSYHESWRQHPKLNNNVLKMLPGFGYAVAIFSTYLVAEFTYNKIFPPQHHGHGHAEEEALEFPRGEGAFEPKAPKKDPYAIRGQ